MFLQVVSKTYVVKVRTILNVTGALISTLGIIIPVAMYARPRDGYRVPPILQPGRNYGTMTRTPKMQLSLALRILSGMEQSNQERLAATQARRCLALIEPWCKRPHLSDQTAQALLQELTGVLNEAQLNRFREGMAGFGGGYNSSGLYYNYEERHRIEAFREVYNPLFPPVHYKEFQNLNPEAQERYKVRYTERQLLLKAWKLRAYPPKAATRRLAAKDSG